MKPDYKIGLYGMGGWSQLFFFIFLFFSGFMLSGLITISALNIEAIGQSAGATRMAMVIQSVCLFLLPSLAFAYLCFQQTKDFLQSGIDKRVTLILLAVCIIIFIQPFINCIGYYNQQIILPDSMQDIEAWMKQKEESSANLIEVIFADRSIVSLLLNIIVIAIIAGVVEELFFRGCLQQIVQKIVINKHIAIWITAILFSAFHFQFYGFVPRLLLGALLGYFYVWSGNIWTPIIAHIFHNAINVLIMYFYYDIPDVDRISYFSLQNNPMLIISSFVLTGLLIFVYIKKASGLKFQN